MVFSIVDYIKKKGRSSQNSDTSPATSTKHLWSSRRIPGDEFPAMIEWEEKLGFHGVKTGIPYIYIYIYIYMY